MFSLIYSLYIFSCIILIVDVWLISNL